MIKHIFLGLIASILLIGCGNSNSIPEGKNFSIEANITGADSIFVVKITPESRVPLDTLFMGEEGKGATYYGHVDKGDFFALVLPNGDIINMFLEPTDKILVNGSSDDFSAVANISGSKISQEIRDLDFYFHETLHKRDSIYKLAGTVDQDRYKEVQDSFNQLSLNHRAYLEKFIKDHIGSPSTIFAIYNVINQTPAFDLYQDYEWFKMVGDSLYVDYPELSHTGFFNKLLSQADAPNFSMENDKGEVVNLTDFRGKWVLLDFWASWCKPCRAQAPLLKNIHTKYPDLEIVSVSIDGGPRQKNPKSDWLNAIKDDGIADWTHLSDLQGGDSPVTRLFGFTSIPFTVVISPEGRIVAKNLRGSNLALFISSRLKK